MLTRQIGKILRGRSSPAQLAMAAVLGGILGFIPFGWEQGAGLMLALFLVVVILNANLGLTAIVAVLGKLLSLALMPVTFEVGRVLLEGPTQGLFRTLINAPVTALFGFEYYATTGGITLGLLYGAAAAVLSIWLVTTFRRKMAALEEGSEKFQKFTSKGWVKALAFVFVGGNKGKRSYADLLQKKWGNPIRLTGVVFAVLVGALLVVVRLLFADQIVTAMTQRGLEGATGATVDLKSSQAELGKGRIVLTGLAMADPQNLSTDLIRASKVEAAVSTADLLRKRISIDKVEVADGSSGQKRTIPGVLIHPQPTPTPPPPPQGGEKTIDDYIAQAKLWKERLAQARQWMDKLSRKKTDEPSAPGAPPKETLKERLRREAREQGYTRVAARHLVEQSPTVLIRELLASGVKTEQLPGEILDVRMVNLSTQPWLVAGAPDVEVKTKSGKLGGHVVLGDAASQKSPSTVAFHYNGLAVDDVASQLKVAGTKPIQGGTMDVSLDGSLGSGGSVDLPLNVTLHNTTLTLAGAGSAKVSELALPIGLRGPMDDPRITIDSKKLADALVKAGASELASKVQGKAQAEAEKVVDKASEKLKDKVGDKAKGVIGDLFGKKKKEEPK
jgi:uncharacterized protein (TIGR03546 family)